MKVQGNLTTTADTLALARPGSGPAVDDEDALSARADSKGPIRLGLWVLVGGFALFVLWAALAPLGEGVVAHGKVSIETRRLPIQHQSGGVIVKVPVAEGQEVKAGDTLVELDERNMRAGFESVRQNYLAQRAIESRLISEQAGAPVIRFHADLVSSGDTVSTQLMEGQQQLFAARRGAFAAEMAAAREQIAGLRGQITGLEQIADSRRARRGLISTQLDGVKALAAEGYAPRNQALQMEEQYLELRGGIADVEAQMQRARNGVAEIEQRIAQRRQEALKEISGLLTEVRRDVEANDEKLAAYRGELTRMRIVAPVDGQVVGLAVAGAGGVVGAGQRLMDIVPRQAETVIDAQVPPHVIDRVRSGDIADVRFSGFVDAPTLVAEGRILSLSGDAVTEQGPGGMVNLFYLARIELTPAGLQTLRGRTMHPGMPAEVLIRTGERSLLTYLLHPLTKRIASAMKEE